MAETTDATQVTAPTTTEAPSPGLVSATKDGMTVTSSIATQSEVDEAVGLSLQPIPEQSTPDLPSEAAKAPEADSTVESPDVTLPTAREDDPPSVQARFKELTTANRTEKRLRQQADADIRGLQAQLAAQAAPAPSAGDADAEPQLETYGEDTQGYIIAHTRWTARDEIRVEMAARDARATTAKSEAVVAQQETNWDTEAAATKARHPDYVEVVTVAAKAVGDHPGLPGLFERLQRIEHGTEIMYRLAAKNPGEFARVSGLSADDQTFELVRISREIQSEAGAPVQEATIPAAVVTVENPIAPVTPRPVVPAAQWKEGDSFESFEIYYKDQTK